MSTEKIAVDIALLPSEEMTDKAIEENEKLLKSKDNKIKLNTKNCLPHITVAMGCVKQSDLAVIDKILGNLAKDFKKFNLKTSSEIQTKAWYKIEDNNELKDLHLKVMETLKPYFTYEATKEMLHKDKDEEINDITLNYIKDFKNKWAFGNYAPHITLASGDFDIRLPSVEFLGEEIALCHLGNFCTCRKILLSYMLKDRNI